jgi:hypothetical protein
MSDEARRLLEKWLVMEETVPDATWEAQHGKRERLTERTRAFLAQPIPAAREAVLVEALKMSARAYHDVVYGEWGHGHTEPFSTCPAGRCVAARAALAPREAKDGLDAE